MNLKKFIFIDKRKETMKNTQYRMEVKFSNIIGKDSVSPGGITKLNKL